MSRNKEFDYDEKLQVARDLFWEKGYNATSMNDLVDALQINRSSLYLTYGNKHDLFLKCLSDYIKEKDYRKIIEKSTTPLKAVEDIMRDILKTILHDDKTCLVTHSVFELGRVDKDVNKLLKEQALSSVCLIEGLLKKAREMGELKTDKDPRMLALFMISGVSAIWNSHILFADSKLTKQMTDFLIESVTK